MTKNMVIGESVYGEKRISVEVRLQHSVGSILLLQQDHNC